MLIIKLIILTIILGGSTSIGYLISKKYKNRVIELKEFRNAINILETKIKFTYEPIKEIFKEISKNTDKKILQIFENTSKYIEENSTKEAWNKSIEETKEILSLNEEDINIIKSLGNMLRKNRCRRSNK